MRNRLATLLLVTGLGLAAVPAGAGQVSDIRVGDLPGTHGAWQFGEVTVDAPAGQVQRWFADAGQWRGRFPDIQSVQVAGRSPDGREIVKFRSSIIGRPLTIRMKEQPGLIVYDGEGKDVTTQGKIMVERVGDHRTKVTLQSSSDVHGAAGMFASTNMKRQRAQKKFRSDLSSIVRLSDEWAATHHD